MIAYLYVALGGALGAMMRYGCGLIAAANLPPSFPFATFAVNIIGSFIIGMIAPYFVINPDASQNLRHFLLAGVLGGFTTFSAFSIDTVTLLQREPLVGLVYMVSSVVLSIAACWIGMIAFRMMTA